MDFSAFVRVTEHYGYIYEIKHSGGMYIIYGIENKRPYMVTGRFDRLEAIRECHYLEKFNAPKHKKKDAK